MSDYFINSGTNDLPDSLTSRILRDSIAFQYHKSLTAYEPTPLISLPALAKKYGVKNIYLKNEAHRFGLNAFKGLGASYAIHKLVERDIDLKTFCTATDGNHGRAVAWAARSEGKDSVIFVPKDTAHNRVDAIEKEGGKVMMTDKNYDETSEIARVTSEQNGWQLVQDSSWEDYEEIPALIMSGYLTHFIELEDSIHMLPKPMIDIVFLQAGVGSWAGAAIWYYMNRYGNQRPKLIIVEPYEAAGILESFEAGKRVIPQGNYETIMAGLNCGMPALNAWEMIRHGADASMKIKDEYSNRAVRELYYPEGNDTGVIAGESGAAGLAGFIAMMDEESMIDLKREIGISDKTNILFFNTEGATDPDNFNKIVSNGS